MLFKMGNICIRKKKDINKITEELDYNINDQDFGKEKPKDKKSIEGGVFYYNELFEDFNK
jgi:hypothetical protein